MSGEPEPLMAKLELSTRDDVPREVRHTVIVWCGNPRCRRSGRGRTFLMRAVIGEEPSPTIVAPIVCHDCRRVNVVVVTESTLAQLERA